MNKKEYKIYVNHHQKCSPKRAKFQYVSNCKCHANSLSLKQDTHKKIHSVLNKHIKIQFLLISKQFS